MPTSTLSTPATGVWSDPHNINIKPYQRPAPIAKKFTSTLNHPYLANAFLKQTNPKRTPTRCVRLLVLSLPAARPVYYRRHCRAVTSIRRRTVIGVPGIATSTLTVAAVVWSNIGALLPTATGVSIGRCVAALVAFVIPRRRCVVPLRPWRWHHAHANHRTRTQPRQLHALESRAVCSAPQAEHRSRHVGCRSQTAMRCPPHRRHRCQRCCCRCRHRRRRATPAPSGTRAGMCPAPGRPPAGCAFPRGAGRRCVRPRHGRAAARCPHRRRCRTAAGPAPAPTPAVCLPPPPAPPATAAGASRVSPSPARVALCPAAHARRRRPHRSAVMPPFLLLRHQRTCPTSAVVRVAMPQAKVRPCRRRRWHHCRHRQQNHLHCRRCHLLPLQRNCRLMCGPCRRPREGRRRAWSCTCAWCTACRRSRRRPRRRSRRRPTAHGSPSTRATHVHSPQQRTRLRSSRQRRTTWCQCMRGASQAVTSGYRPRLAAGTLGGQLRRGRRCPCPPELARAPLRSQPRPTTTE
eukprot:m.1318568 g.1318568  ORF g.1318568 m.1318568 type:complete len:519 (-) comp24841_c0_seq41:2241-3797(-)